MRFSRIRLKTWEGWCGQTCHQTRPRRSRGGADLETTENGASANEFPGFGELLQVVHQGLCGQSISNATTHEAQGQEIHVELRGRVAI